MMNRIREELISKAYEAKEYAYAPYSGFKVGAAILTDEDEIFTGCNIENAAFTPTVCAERTALFKAVSNGSRTFKAIAICSDNSKDYISPCGVCRQALSEFVDENFVLYLCRTKDDYKTLHFSEVMPYIFGKNAFVEE